MASDAKGTLNVSGGHVGHLPKRRCDELGQVDIKYTYLVKMTISHKIQIGSHIPRHKFMVNPHLCPDCVGLYIYIYIYLTPVTSYYALHSNLEHNLKHKGDVSLAVVQWLTI